MDSGSGAIGVMTSLPKYRAGTARINACGLRNCVLYEKSGIKVRLLMTTGCVEERIIAGLRGDLHYFKYFSASSLVKPNFSHISIKMVSVGICNFFKVVILSILVYTFFSRMFDLMLPPVAKHSIVVA